MNKIFLFFIFHFLLFISVSAQTDSLKFLTDTTTLESVTVTAFGSNAKWKDAPAAVALINYQQLQRFDNKTLVPVLNTITGVRMEERSPGSYRLSIRGSLLRSPFGIRNIKVYWNEIPLTDAGGNTYLNLIDINQIQSAEIIKGPAASMYGANTGGAVLLKSDPSSPNPKGSKSSFSAGVETGSYNLLNEQLAYNHHTKNISFNIQQSHLQNSGYRQQSSLRRDAFKGDLKWYINNKEELSALVFYTNLHYETPGGITKQQFDSLPTLSRQPTATLPGSIQQKAAVFNKTGFIGLSLHSALSKIWNNTTSITINNTGFRNPFITNYEKRNELNYGARTVFEFNVSKLKWLSGGEWQQNISHINNYDNNGGVKGNLMYDDAVHVMQYFVFTQLNYSLNKLTVQAGLSANQQQLKYNRLSDSVYNHWQYQNTNILLAPRLSLLYNFTKAASLYAIAAKGFSPPTLEEVRPSTNQFYNLQPEYGWNFELGLKGSALRNFMLFDASVYAFDLKHAIVEQQDSSGADFFVNSGGTKENGAEVWLRFNIIQNNNFFIKSVSVANSFSYQPYKFNTYISGTKNFKGNNLTGVPKFINVSTLDVNTKAGIYLNATYNYTSSIPLTNANDVYAKSYRLLQLKLGYQKAALNFYAGIDNVLNENYSLGNDLNAVGGRYFNAAPKCNWFAGIQIKF